MRSAERIGRDWHDACLASIAELEAHAAHGNDLSAAFAPWCDLCAAIAERLNHEPVATREGEAAESREVARPMQRNSTDETIDASNRPHRGVVMTGDDGAEGPKAFYIEIEARRGKEAEVEKMLRDILACVENEPATGPWFGVRHSETKFAIFEAFPTIAGRQAHVDGGGGDIFRDLERMNAILEKPAHVQKVDVLLSKKTFA